MWTISVVFIEFVRILFYVLVFWWGMWDLSSRPGMESTPSALADEILTPGPPGKSLFHCFGSF